MKFEPLQGRNESDQVDVFAQSIKEAQGSELNATERDLVAAFKPKLGDAIRLGSEIEKNAAGIIPTREDSRMMVRILGALPENRIPKEIDGNGPHKLWLLTEAYILQGKNPDKIHEAALAAMTRGNMKNLGF